eukprot:tig00000237_g20454.t1
MTASEGGTSLPFQPAYAAAAATGAGASLKLPSSWNPRDVRTPLERIAHLPSERWRRPALWLPCPAPWRITEPTLSHLRRGLLHDSGARLTTSHPSFIDLGDGHLKATYVGQGKSDAEAAAVRANCAIPAAAGIFYWETRIVSKGRDGYIGVGVCSQSVSLNRLPGWERGSFGYHGDDGNSFRGSGTGTAYGPTFTTGDIIGTCVNFLSNTIFYTKNGVSLGVAFSDVKGTLFPTAGLRTPQECVEANFGQKPFRFDIETYVRDEKERLRAAAEATPLPAGPAPPLLPRLVLSYLLHAGYAESAAAFGRAARLLPEGELEEELERVHARRRICARVLAGDIDGAVAEIEARFPGFLARDRRLALALKRQKFVELFRTAPLAETMAYGQAELAPHFNVCCEEDRNALCEVFSLMAYIEPASSPVAYLLAPGRREPVAGAVEAALLEEQGRPAAHALERAAQQAAVCLAELVAENTPGAALLDLRDALGLAADPEEEEAPPAGPPGGRGGRGPDGRRRGGRERGLRGGLRGPRGELLGLQRRLGLRQRREWLGDGLRPLRPPPGPRDPGAGALRAARAAGAIGPSASLA